MRANNTTKCKPIIENDLAFDWVKTWMKKVEKESQKMDTEKNSSGFVNKLP